MRHNLNMATILVALSSFLIGVSSQNINADSVRQHIADVQSDYESSFRQIKQRYGSSKDDAVKELSLSSGYKAHELVDTLLDDKGFESIDDKGFESIDEKQGHSENRYEEKHYRKTFDSISGKDEEFKFGFKSFMSTRFNGSDKSDWWRNGYSEEPKYLSSEP